MSEDGEGSLPIQPHDSLKTRLGRNLLRVAIGGNQDNGLDFKSVRIVGKHLREIDDQIPDKGLPLALKEHFQRLRYNVEPQYQAAESKDALERCPALVIATHPSLMDPVNLIASLPEVRKDMSIVGNTVFQTLGDNFSQHVIPIYRAGNSYRVEGKALLWRKYGIPQEEHALLEAGRLNKESLRVGAEKINEGGLVLFLPDGSTEGKEWYNGIGELVKQIVREDARIVFAATEKPRIRDYGRIFSTVAGYMPPTTTHVAFSEPHSVEEYAPNDVNKRIITQNLKQSYEFFAQHAV